MHVTFPRSALLSILKITVPVSDPKSPMPALANVLIDAGDGAMSVTATDIYRSAHGTLSEGVVVTKPGRSALPGKGLLQRVEAMPEGPVEIVVGADEATTIKSLVRTKLLYKMTGLPASQFPSIATPKDDARWIALPSDALRGVLDKTFFCASDDTTRANFNCVVLTIGNGKIRGAACDGHRAAIVVRPVDGAKDDLTVLVPKNGADHLRKIVDDAAAQKVPVEMLIDGPNIMFRVGHTRYSVKLTEAVSPPYDRFMPVNQPYKMRLPRKAMIDAVKATTIAADDKTGEVLLSFKANEVTLSASDSAKGAASDTLAIDYAGEPVALGFFAPYLIETLTKIDSDEIIFECSPPPKAGTTESNGATIAPTPCPEGHSDTFLVLPLYR